jgi:osmotically-inducible protein OsmY
VRALITNILLEDPDTFSVTAHNGTVTLSGSFSTPETARAALQLAADADGVVAVVDRLTREPLRA